MRVRTCHLVHPTICVLGNLSAENFLTVVNSGVALSNYNGMGHEAALTVFSNITPTRSPLI